MQTVDGKARPKLPVTVGLLAEIREQLELSEHNHLVAWAVLTMGVFGMFRLGELLPEGDKSLVLGENSVLWVNAGHAQVMLKASKTDPFREGVCVNLFAQLEDTVCPLAALRAVLAGRPAAMAGKPLFTLSLGSVMTRAQLVEVLRMTVRDVAQRLNIKFDENQFSGHSLRKGGATSLALRMVPDHLIQVLGRWRSDSYKLYISMSPERLAEASRAMGRLDEKTRSADLGIEAGVLPGPAPVCGADEDC